MQSVSPQAATQAVPPAGIRWRNCGHALIPLLLSNYKIRSCFCQYTYFSYLVSFDDFFYADEGRQGPFPSVVLPATVIIARQGTQPAGLQREGREQMVLF